MSKAQKVLELSKSGLRNVTIAERLGLSPSYVSKVVQQGSDYLTEEADKRHITVNELRKRIMNAIEKDRMVGAILDDGV